MWRIVEQSNTMPRVLVLLSAVLFGTTGTAQALGPDAAPVTVGAARIAVGGVLLLVLGGGPASADPLGIMLAVVSGSGYATYTILAKRALRRGHAPERVMAAAFALGALLLLPVLALGDTAWLATGSGLAMALFLGAVPT